MLFVLVFASEATERTYTIRKDPFSTKSRRDSTQRPHKSRLPRGKTQYRPHWPIESFRSNLGVKFRWTIKKAIFPRDHPPLMTKIMSRSIAAPPAKQQQKTSLGFICSPSSVSSSYHVTSPYDAMTGQTKRRQKSGLETLCREALAHIAYDLVVDDDGIGRHPSALLPLLLTSRSIYEAISFDNNPQLYNRLFRATFDHAALSRRYDWMVHHLADVAGRGRKVFDLFNDPRSWAIDYKTRWEQSWRMRQVVKQGRLEIPGICDMEQVSADLWNLWFLLTENGE